VKSPPSQILHVKDLLRVGVQAGSDALMSYFTRIYDGYYYKFCLLIKLAEVPTKEWKLLK
jgi:hypothetical protein